ncbi:MurR/RpiR family transcriptional regulator [Cetobacterium sp.]|uniref:MurR/RpiR family transcriptional regulator n=1 Tax=Cetobacterium sp. TaxID=2071632 RepID=UPI003F340420
MDLTKLQNRYNLNESELLVLKFILEDLDRALKFGIKEIAQNNFCSTTVVVNLAKKMKYSGFTDMIYNLKFIYQNKSEPLKEKEYFFDLDLNSKLEIYERNESEFFKLKDILTAYKDKLILLYGVGFSEIIAKYFQLKLLNNSYLSIFSNQHQNYEATNLAPSLVIIVSKSGETGSALTILKKARENGAKVVAFTNENRNTIGELADINFKLYDSNKLDDRNINANEFFPNCVLCFEMIIEFVK